MTTFRRYLTHSRLLPAALALMLAGAFIAACAPAAIPTATSSTAAPQPTATTSLQPTETSPLSTPQPAAAPTPNATTFPTLTLASIRMFDTTNGWATGWLAADRASDYRLPVGDVYRTTDGGAHWQMVTPTGAAPESISSIYFLDAQHAWAAVSARDVNSPTLTIYATQDGGQSWQDGAPIVLPDGEGFGPIDFVDAQYGRLMATLDIGAGSQAVAIYKTADGGMDWQEVSRTSDAAGTLPRGCIKSGISFVDDNTGWVTGSCPGGPIYLFVTHDGGGQWQRQTLTPPSGYDAQLFDQCQCSFQPPIFTSDHDGVMALQIFEAEQSDALYITHDSGATWTSVVLPLKQVVRAVDFVDTQNGWLSDGQQFIVTQDGGQSWTPLPDLPGGNPPDSLDFVDSDMGWLVVEPQLYKTQDGGHTWTAATPMLNESSVPAQGSTDQTLSVTLADNDKLLQLKVSQRFLLNLGDGYTWTVEVDNQAIISRVVNITVVRGAQGVYEAHAPGQATLTATGDPVCRQSKPPCGMPSRVFTLHVTVQ